MRVDQDGGAEDGVHGWVEGAADEWGEGERDEADGDEALGGPVIGAVYWVGVWDLGGVVGWTVCKYIGGCFVEQLARTYQFHQ